MASESSSSKSDAQKARGRGMTNAAGRNVGRTKGGQKLIPTPFLGAGTTRNTAARGTVLAKRGGRNRKRKGTAGTLAAARRAVGA